MTIGERIFELLEKNHMSQKDLSEKTGIPATTISDWKKKKTNPASDKILLLCDVFQITPYELLSGVTENGNRSRESDYLVISKNTEAWELLHLYSALDTNKQGRLLGYLRALSENSF